MQPLTQAGNPWFGSAGEMTALAMIKQGKKQQAGQLFATIAKDKTVPQSIRDRSSRSPEASASTPAPHSDLRLSRTRMSKTRNLPALH